MTVNNTVVQCKKCDRQQLVEFAHCLRHGWPECHGATMGLVEQPADIEGETRKAITGEATNTEIIERIWRD